MLYRSVVAASCLLAIAVAAPALGQTAAPSAVVAPPNPGEKVEKLRQLLAGKPDAEAARVARLDLAAALSAAGQVIQATETYEEYLRTYPTHESALEAQYLLGRAYEAQGKFVETVDAFNKFLRNPGKAAPARVADTRFAVAEILDYVLNSRDKASEAYQAFIKAFPADKRVYDARVRIAGLLDKSRKFKEAAEAYRQVVKDFPTQPLLYRVQLRLAQVYDQYGLSDWEQAATEYRNYIKLFPKRPDVQDNWLRIALLHRDYLRQYDKAREAYDEAIKISSTEDIQWDRQEALWKGPDNELKLKALRAYETQFPKTPRLLVVRQRVAYALFASKKVDEAIAAWEQLIKDFPDDTAETRWQLIHRYEEKEDWRHAYEHAEAMLKLDSDYGGYGRCSKLLNAALKANDPALLDRAEKALLEVLERSGHLMDYFGTIRWSLGKTLYLDQRKDYAKAIEQFRALMNRLPYDGGWSNADNCLNNLVAAYRGKNDLPGAIKELREYHKRFPDSPSARHGRAIAARLLVELKDDAAALAEATQVIDPDLDDPASADATLTAAECCGRQKDEMKMLALLTRMGAMRLEPGHQQVHVRVDEIRLRVLKPLVTPKPPAAAAPATPPAATPATPPPAATTQAAPAVVAPTDILKRGMAQHGLGEFAKAMQDYDAFLTTPAAQGNLIEQVKALRADAERLSKFDDYFKAGELAQLPTMSLYRCAATFEGARKWSEAVNAYKACVKRSPLHVLARIKVAENHANLGAYADAGQAYLDLLRDVPAVRDEYRHALVALWHTYWKDLAQTETMRTIIAEAAKARPDPRTYYWGVYLYKDYEPKDLQIALKYAKAYETRRAVDRVPTFGPFIQIEVFNTLKHFAKAAKAAEDWIAANPNDTVYMDYVMFQAAEAWRQAETTDKPKAIAAYQALVDKFPTTRWGRDSFRQLTELLAGAERDAMLRKFMAANPKDIYAAFALWRLPEVAADADPVKRLEIWRRIWTDYRGMWWESMWAVSSVVDHYTKQKQFDEAARYAQEAVDYYGARHEAAWAWERLMRYYRDEKKNEAAFLAFAGENTRRYNEAYYPYGGFAASLLEREFYLAKGDFVSAAIALHWGIALMTPNDPKWSMDQVLSAANSLSNEKRFEEAATIVRTALATVKPKDELLRATAENFMGSCLTQGGGGLSVIDPKLPQAGLLNGDVFARAGEETLAYKKFIENRNLFDKYKNDLSPAYIILIARRLADAGESEAAVDLCRGFIIQRKDDKRVTDADRATVQLLLGDCYFREQRFDIARSEYATCVNLYKDTPQAVLAQFKVGESFAAQKMYDKAEAIFTELIKSPDEDTMVRAMLMQGFLYHAQGKKQETVDQFRKVLAMNPKSEVADELFYRMGIVYQESGKLREAYDLYRLVGSGGREVKRLVAPGTQLFFRLTDRDLNITRGEARVPILIESSSGDSEQTMLHESEAGTGIFVGDIPVALGRPTPGDHVLQVRGTDTLVYRYHPDFVRDFVLAESPIEDRTVRVASDAELDISGSEIPAETDEATAARRAIQNWTALTTPEGRRIFRRADEIKPGNNLYVRVIDRDMDRTDEKDTIPVTVTADSGDKVEMAMVETQAHSGIFRGAVPTGDRPPDASASDSADGFDAARAIDGDPATAWEGRHDGKNPKWLMVDLKQVYPVTKISWLRGQDKEDRLPKRYIFQGSLDNKQWQPLAIFPADPGMLTNITAAWDPDNSIPAAEMLQANGDVRAAWNGTINKKEHIIDLDLGSVTAIRKTILRPNDGYREVREYTLLVEKEKGTYPGRVRTQDGWRSVYTKRLDQPVVDEAELKDVEGRYLRILITDQFHDRPEIGEFEIYPVLPKPLITAAEKGKGASIAIAPSRCRYVRMLITEQDQDAPAIGGIEVWSEAKRLAPSEVNLHDLAANTILEISPGDEITVSYSDQVNISAGQPRICKKSVKATYYDGVIEAVRHSFYDDANGNRIKIDYSVYRVDPGERFIIQVTDYDADRTDNVDTLPMKVKSESGAELSLTATETGAYTGIFTKEVDTSATPAEGRLAVKAGERIAISYVDEYNTNPGNRFDRTGEVLANQPSAGAITIRPARAYKAKAPATGEPKPVSLDEPMLVEVRDPDRAHCGSDSIVVHLSTSSGDTADVECFLHAAEGMPHMDSLRMLKDGLFIGSIRLMLGDKNSPDTIVEALKVDAQSYRQGIRKAVEETVLNVSGQDLITAAYEDAASPADAPNTARKDTARLMGTALVGIFDDQYENPVTQLHVGENLYVRVVDPDADVSANRDSIKVTLQSSTGDTWTGELTETLSNSGVFTRAVMVEQASKPDPANDIFEADFDADVTLTYVDERQFESAQPVTRKATAKVVMGSDGRVSAFGKKYPSLEVAVETQFKIAECFYYLGRKHMELAAAEKTPEAKDEMTRMAREELGSGQRILDELVHGYPDTRIMDQACYLLACLAQEQQRYDDAIESFRRICRDWPDSTVAAEAQYKIGMCFEKKGDFQTACDEYVRLAYKHPDSTLVGDAMIRIGLQLFDDKKYDDAVGVYERFIEKYPLHAAIEEVWFKMGLALIAQEKFVPAAEHYQRFITKFPESPLKASAIYWAGDSYMKATPPDAQKAYQMFKRVVWDFPESKWAKWARGQLASPTFEKME